MKWLTKDKRSKIIDITAVIFITAVFFIWSFQITTDLQNIFAGPDEAMRYVVPQFILDNQRLPTGYETEIHGNWSYAFYPQLLGAIVSSGFMVITSLFTDDPSALVRAARLTSVLFGVIAAVFIRKSARLLFENHPNKGLIGNTVMITFALLPQVTYLSAYINNDIVALAGVSIIVYACLYMHKTNTSFISAIYFAIGSTIAVLGYQNSYGFVLMGLVYLAWSLFSYYKQTKDKSFLVRYLLIALGIPALLCLPFIIRNALLYNGDVIGVNTFRSEYSRWLKDTGTMLQFPYKDGLIDLLINSRWLMDTIKTSITGYFAGLGRGVSATLYLFYYVFFFVGAISFVAYLRDLKKRLGTYVFGGCIVTASAITIALSLYYTLNIDYQPQGRYIIYLAIPFILASYLGIVYSIHKVVGSQYLVLSLILINIAYIGMHALIFTRTLLQ